MSSPNSRLSNTGGATSGNAPQVVCDCPCHNTGQGFPCGAMCWHPGVDQFGMSLSYYNTSVSQLLKAAFIRGSSKSIDLAVYEALMLTANEASTGVHTPVAANDGYNKLRKWLIALLVNGDE